MAIHIHVLPAYHLEERIERRPLAEMAERLDELAAATRHFEFFVFPYSDLVIFKTLHPAEPEGAFVATKDGSENIFRTACRVGQRLPFAIPGMQRLMMGLSGKATRRTGPAYAIFPSERSVRFEEMEYEMPRANGMATLMEVIAHVRARRLPIAFPLEFRVTAADDIWMSPFNARPAASISFHQYAGMAWRGAFTEIEAIMRAGDGRPHWAKRHTLTADDIHRLYPMAPDYLRVRDSVDPAQKFANAELARLFGLGAPRKD